jgi:oligopeptide transport system substrate-binding protein
LTAFLSCSVLFSGCFEEEAGEQFYGRVAVPRAQEFRWSDGGLPRVFDPARAAAPPDTDAVRALYEGLTDYEPTTLRPVPAVASKWESADGGRVWTFHLRRDARWSNGDAVTARDFVRSWRRTLALGERAPHSKLLSNIVGARTAAPTQTPEPSETPQPAASPTPRNGAHAASATQAPAHAPAVEFGAAALDAQTLRVRLQRPDKNFPALVAHHVFRPVHELSAPPDLDSLEGAAAVGDARASEGAADFGFLTNGAFSLSRLDPESVVLVRAKNYWDAASVRLERVRFVGKETAEAALAAYRAGELDAVTNAPFEPLGVKLLTPYKDFRRQTFGALNYYAFNTSRPPFDDRRVREALASALDLERLSEDTLGGSTEPARRFLPESAAPSPLRHDAERARRLLSEAGFQNGAGFPAVRLLVNRNEQQRLVAVAVARMWREVLGIETEVVVRNWEEYEAMLRAGDYDVARRSIVMQTTDEESNMLALFGDPSRGEESAAETAAPESSPAPSPAEGEAESPDGQAPRPQRTPILTESQAAEELPAIPLYFASSYALVKPYVEGFDSNLLDAPSLKHARINTGWQPPPSRAKASVLLASP